MSGWGHHNCNTARMAEIIEAEYSNVDGSSKPWTTCKWQNKPKKTKNGGISDQGNEDFSASSGGEGELSSDTENDSDVMEITNKEEFRALLHFYFKIYCDWLDFICSWPTLCLQKLSHLSAAPPRQKQRASGHKPSVYDLQFKLMAPTMRPLFHKELLHDKRPKKTWRYIFFFIAPCTYLFLGWNQLQPYVSFFGRKCLNADGKMGGVGDKHYRCYHRHQKVFTITKAMNHSLNGKFDIFCSFLFLILTMYY